MTFLIAALFLAGTHNSQPDNQLVNVPAHFDGNTVVDQDQKELDAAIAERDRLSALGQWKDALPFAQKAAEIVKKFKPRSMEAMQMLGDVGFVASSGADYPVAIASYLEALELARELVPKKSPEADIHYNLGWAYSMIGKFSESKDHLLSSEWILDKVSPESEQRVNTLNLLAGTLLELGSFRESLKTFEKALGIAEKIAPRSPLAGQSRLGLGNAQFRLGDISKAATTYREVQKLMAELGMLKSFPYGYVLINLGAVEKELGNYFAARGYYQDALKLWQKLSPDSIEIGYAISNLGSIDSELGDDESALRQYQASLAIISSHAPGSLKTATAYENIGVSFKKLGNIAQAVLHEMAALAIVRKQAPNSAMEARLLHNLALCAIEAEDFELAERNLADSLRIRSNLEPGSLSEAGSQRSMGSVLLTKGDVDAGISFFKKSQETTTRLAPQSLAAVAIHLELSMAHRMKGEMSEGRDHFSSALATINQVLTREGFAAAADLGSLGRVASDVLGSLGQLQDASEFYEAVPSLKGAELAVQHRWRTVESAEQNHSEIAAALGAVQIARREETTWAANTGLRVQDESTWFKELENLRSVRLKAEQAYVQALAAHDPRFEQQSLRVTTQQVQMALQPDETLVEFLITKGWDEKLNRPGRPEYSAFVVTSQSVRFIPLGSAEEVDELVGKWRSTGGGRGPERVSAPNESSEAQLNSLGRQLFQRLIKPLGALSRNVRIAPDGQLHSLPFAALVDEKGRYLLESHVMSFVGSGRDLIDRRQDAETGPAIVIGAPDYDFVGKDSGSKLDYSERPSYATAIWRELPGTEEEARLVALNLGVRPLMGEEASEVALMSVRRPRVLHIATHGFFVAPDSQDMTRPTMSLLQSGLVLAGANVARQREVMGLADGWATALELTSLDLRGNELTVLSACDTGRGSVRATEGVFGLQRAFRLAGSQSLMISLFSVPDDATRALMAKFYRRWKPDDPSGSKVSSFREAQLEMLRNPTTSHPENWAGFILYGDR